MATTIQRMNADVQANEPTGLKRSFDFDAGTHEAQTVTVSKGIGAFAPTAGTTATQNEGTLYSLIIHPDDIDAEGEVTFKCAGATDTKYLTGFRVVDYDPFDDIASILDDTETSGVAVSGTGASTVSDQVWAELVDDHDGVAGSFAELLRLVRQVAAGKLVTDSTAETVRIYDADGVTLLVTLTMAEAGINITRTPS